MGKLIDYINDNYDFAVEYERYTGKSCPTRKGYCLWHHNVNTPAGAYYKDSNRFRCFVCGRTYGVYDLWQLFDPDRIDEVKSSVILTDTETPNRRRVKVVRVLRDRPLCDIYRQILTENDIATVQ